jgi:hypothetical protein
MTNFADYRTSQFVATVLFQSCTRPRASAQLVKAIVLGTVLAVMFAGTVAAADLIGTVTTKTPKMTKPEALASASVSVEHTVTRRKTVTRTSSAGAYLFKNLPSGLYVILVEKDGRRMYQGKVEVSAKEKRFDIGL